MIIETLKQMRLLLNTKNASVFVLLACTLSVHAQTTKPDNKQQPPATSAIRPAGDPVVTDIREKLVQLALQNPTYEVVDRKVSIAMYNVKRAKGSWLNFIAVQGNINQFSIQKQETTPGQINPGSLYPKYNVNATIPFDFFSAKKNDVRIAKENVGIAQAEKNQRFREIKVQVLTKYEDYLLFQQKLDFQSQVTQDARTVYLAAEKDFQEGAIKQEEYTKSYRGYTDEKARQFEYQRNYNVVKLELEAMIGISMEDLLKK